MTIHQRARRSLRLLVALLALLMILTLGLCACRNTPDQPEPGPEPEPDVPKFNLVDENGAFPYVIVRGDYAKSAVTKMAAIVHVALEGVLDRDDVEITTDETPAAAYEILIGKTNRPESEEILSTLGERQYAVRVMNEGKTIVIVGVDDAQTVKAVDYFLRKYVGYDYITEVVNVKENISIPLELNEVLTYENTQEHSDAPIIVQTHYVTEDTVVADIIAGRENYGVDPTGVADSTDGIQRALDDCEARGGGTVFFLQIADVDRDRTVVQNRAGGNAGIIRELVRFKRSAGDVADGDGLTYISGNIGALECYRSGVARRYQHIGARRRRIDFQRRS